MVKNPDFIIIPYMVLSDKELMPIDKNLYGIIYWLECLKDGCCTASNKTLAELVICSETSIAHALERLEKQGYVKRYFRDVKKKHRQGIESLVKFRKKSDCNFRPSLDCNFEQQNNNTNNKNNIYISKGLNSLGDNFRKRLPKLVSHTEVVR